MAFPVRARIRSVPSTHCPAGPQGGGPRVAKGCALLMLGMQSSASMLTGQMKDCGWAPMVDRWAGSLYEHQPEASCVRQALTSRLSQSGERWPPASSDTSGSLDMSEEWNVGQAAECSRHSGANLVMCHRLVVRKIARRESRLALWSWVVARGRVSAREQMHTCASVYLGCSGMS